MHRLRLCKHLVCAAFLLCTVVAAPANLLVNGSFEDPVVPNGLYFTNTTISFSGWTGSSGTNTEFRQGYAGIVHGSSLGLAPADGNQAFCFNIGNPPAGSGIGSYIEQTIATSQLQADKLTFAIGRDITSTQTLTLNVDLYDGSSGQHFSGGSFTPPATAGYAVYSYTFNNSFGTSTRIRFTDTSASNPDSDLLLDNVSVTVLGVPEPSGPALFTVFAALWSVKRYRRLHYRCGKPFEFRF